ncbi:hypothetical protein AQUCO_03500201v1 [Aquilegia coerulea]|uniref:Uncharacterized protein n=1 Tax=Aquilegia coerulea TaxID=218851 RepID=A0A2G5CWN9_AQUCA|nr:hypothetical protein AQUCO_03500201v1 [Aquilegia coerulea]
MERAQERDEPESKNHFIRSTLNPFVLLFLFSLDMALSIIRTCKSIQFIRSSSSSSSSSSSALWFSANYRFFKSSSAKMFEKDTFRQTTGRMPHVLSVRTMTFANPFACGGILRISPHDELIMAHCAR